MPNCTCLSGCGTLGSMISLYENGLLLVSRRIFLHKAQVPEWCMGIPSLVHWAVIAMFCMAAVDLACFVCMGACGCVSVDACLHVYIHIRMQMCVLTYFVCQCVCVVVVYVWYVPFLLTLF